MQGQPHVGQSILYFRAIVKAETANELVAQPPPPENLFEGARLRVRAVFDGAGLVRIVGQYVFQFTSHELRFSLRIPRLKKVEVRARALLRAEGFSQPVWIVCDDCASGIENILCRAVIAFELDDACRREISGKTEQNGNIGPAPTVNGLILVAYDADILIWPDQQTHYFVLHAVRILVFVHVNVSETRLPLLARGRRFSQQIRGTQQQIIKIQRLATVQQLFVRRENFGDPASVLVKRGSAHLFRSLCTILGKTDPAEDVSWRQAVVFDLQLVHRQLYGR